MVRNGKIPDLHEIPNPSESWTVRNLKFGPSGVICLRSNKLRLVVKGGMFVNKDQLVFWFLS